MVSELSPRLCDCEVQITEHGPWNETLKPGCGAYSPYLSTRLTLFLASSNCVKLGRICKYLAPVIPLRERRRLDSTLPGEHIPWLIAGDPVDPFDSLSIEMPYKSRELLHYCNCATSRFPMWADAN